MKSPPEYLSAKIFIDGKFKSISTSMYNGEFYIRLFFLLNILAYSSMCVVTR